MSTKAFKYLEKELGPLTFSKMLHAIRSTDEITQVELADAIGVSKGIICDIEKERRLPTIEQAKAMATYLGYPIEGFISLLLQDQLRKADLELKVILEKAS